MLSCMWLRYRGFVTWKPLQRYTHLRQTGDKYENWRRFPTITEHNSKLRFTKNGAFPRRRRSQRNATAQERLFQGQK